MKTLLYRDRRHMVGVGTTAPATKLRIDNSGPVESTIKSTNERAILTLDSSPSGQRRVWTLEFSTNMLANAPGRLSRYDQPDGVPVVLVSNLISPTSLVCDETTGDLFVTEIFAGRITRVHVP